MSRPSVTLGLVRWLAPLLLAAPVLAACPPEGQSRATLQAAKAARWPAAAPGGEAARQALALALLDCLADPDPALRDGLAYEALQAWMRGRQLDTSTVREIGQRLLAVLDAPPDAAGFAQPFAALVLAEVARVDRLQPFLQADERAAMLAQSARYLAGVRDYRGFDAREGWRHGVAHGADLLLQWSLNPALTVAQAGLIRDAIAAQVMPAGEQAWRFGEPERLMAPVYYLARRPDASPADWQAWFEALAAQRERPAEPTPRSLAQRHNLGSFLSALYVAVQESPDARVRERLLAGLRAALRTLD